MQAPPINEEQQEQVLRWIDSKSFTRPRKNLVRDFSDGVLIAQLMKHYFPREVQLHNYTDSNSLSAKYINWKTINQKIFKKLDFFISKYDIENIINNKPGVIERVLFYIYCRLNHYQHEKSSKIQQKNQQNDFSLLEKNNDHSLNYAKQISSQLVQKDQIIKQLRDTVLILQQKMKKMQQLNKLKDNKIQSLLRKIQQKL